MKYSHLSLVDPCYVNSIPQIPGPGKSLPALPAPPAVDPSEVLGTSSVAV